MKHIMIFALLAAPPAFAQDVLETPTLQNGSSFQLQGWTRLNGTAPFQSVEAAEPKAPVSRASPSLRQKRLQQEAEYQREKAAQKRLKGWN